MTSNYSRAISKSIILALPLLLGALLFFPAPLLAQGSGEAGEGINSGNYNIRQTFEIGYRWEDITGNRSTYNTFVNLNPGPRLFEHSLEMRSLNHQGQLFDSFSLHSFGYGGDPNNVTRLRAYKNKWYNLSGTFRRDRNFWDYRLLGNPLNPNAYAATVPSGTPLYNTSYSPHRMEITRRMMDYDLTIAPQSQIRARVGYSRNISDGPSLSNVREGTETTVLQDWKTTLNSFRMGVDFKMLPKTNISFDQFLHFYKNDTTYSDPIVNQLVLGQSILSRPIYQLSNGQLVDIGAIYNFTASQPCSSTTTAPFITNAATTPPTIKGACNGYLQYQRAGNVRTSHPASQVSFQTSYFKNLDISGRLVYSTSDFDVVGSNSAAGYAGAVTTDGIYEFIQGLGTRTNRRQLVFGGPASGKRQSWTGDLAGTWYVTDSFRITNQFRYDRFRIPGSFDQFERSLFPGNPAAPQPAVSLTDTAATFTQGTAPPASCLTATSVGCPRHTTSSSADINSTSFANLLKMRTINYQTDVAYDFTRHYGGHVGYRFRERRIDIALNQAFDRFYFPTLPNRGGCTPGTSAAGSTATNLPDGSCRLVGTTSSSEEETLKEHSALFGLWARPNDQWRLSYDMELLYSDHAFTRISPRQRQRYKIRASYKPTDWFNIAGHINILEQRNNVDQIFHTQHNRTYAFAVTMMKPSWSFDFGYDLNEVDSKTNICFTLTTVPLPPGSGPCPISVPAATTFAVSTYDNRLHFAYFNFMWKPVKRLTTKLGYTISSTSGDALILGPINTPRGTLAYNWHTPYAGVDIELQKHVTWKTGWNYYGYNEKQAADVLTSPLDSLGRLVGRDFRGNLFTSSVRFVF